MGNPAIQTLTASGTWTAPAGVKKITVTPKYKKDWSKCHIGQNATSAFLTAQKAYCAFGNNNNGQLGYSDFTPRSTPVFIGTLNYKKFFANDDSGGLSTISNSSFALDNQNRTWAWGSDDNFVLGTGSTTVRPYLSIPTLVAGSLSFKKILVSKQNTSFFLTKSNQLYSCGGNQDGATGSGSFRTAPTLILNNISDVFLGSNRNVHGAATAVTFGGTWYVWGTNLFGILGTNENPSTVPAKSSPVIFPGNYISVQNENLAALALGTNNKLYTWGSNSAYSLGDNSPTSFARSSPVMIAAAQNFIKIFGGAGQMAVDENNDLYCWGFGGGTTPSVTSTPILILNGPIKKVWWSYNSGVSFALKENGDVYAWGNNTLGQLGLGDIIFRSTPTLITTLNNIVYVCPSFTINFAINSAGDVYSWGANNQGGLGLGSVFFTSTPTMITSLKIQTIEMSELSGFPSSTNVSVTPGTAYTVTFATEYSTFGSTNIAYGELESLAISYSQ